MVKLNTCTVILLRESLRFYFTTKCMPRLLPCNTHKVQPWSTCYIFLSYSIQHKRYKCLIPPMAKSSSCGTSSLKSLSFLFNCLPPLHIRMLSLVYLTRPSPYWYCSMCLISISPVDCQPLQTSTPIPAHIDNDLPPSPSPKHPMPGGITMTIPAPIHPMVTGQKIRFQNPILHR